MSIHLSKLPVPPAFGWHSFHISHYVTLKTLQVKGWISIPIKAKVFAAWKISLQSTGGTGSWILGGQTGKKSNDLPGGQINDPSLIQEAL